MAVKDRHQAGVAQGEGDEAEQPGRQVEKANPVRRPVQGTLDGSFDLAVLLSEIGRHEMFRVSQSFS